MAIISIGIYLFNPTLTAHMQSKNVETAAGLTIAGVAFSNGENGTGATVILESARKTVTTTTDENGAYSFTNVAAGKDYTVTIYKDGFVFDSASRTIQNLQNNEIVNFGVSAMLCSPAPITQNVWYRAENNAADASGANNNGTFTGTASYAAGKVGQSFGFDGTNRLQSANGAFPLGNQPRTMMMWVYLNSLGFNENFFAGYGAFGTNNGAFILGAFPDGRVFLSQWGSDLATIQTLQPGSWYHIAVVYTEEEATIYIDGSVAANDSFHVDTQPGALTVGQAPPDFQTPDRKLNGRIDELQIYDRALSGSEIRRISNAGSAGVCTSATPTGAGTLDPSFGTNGKVLTPLGAYDIIYGSALQTDGKIVAAGVSATTTDYYFALTRYNTDGSLDSSFGSGGKVLTTINTQLDNLYLDLAYDVAIQPDGKIIAVGESRNQNATDGNMALARFNPNGSLDTSFGTGGRLLTPFNARGAAKSVLVQPDGKIVIGGRTVTSNNAEDFALVRYNADGSPDGSFGTGGKVTTTFTSSFDEINKIVIQPDGKIVAVGSSFSSGFRISLARYNTNGALDTTFGTGGKVVTLIGSDSIGNSAAILADGKILVAGNSRNANLDVVLVRYNANGSVDTSFGTNGSVTTDAGDEDQANSLAIQTNGRVVVAGNSGNAVFLLARYDASGALDRTFGSGGKILTTFGGQDYANSVLIQTDGRIVAAGQAFSGAANVFGLARFNGDGSNVVSLNGVRVSFSNINTPGNTVADTLTSAQIPALPASVTLYPSASIYDVRTSALFSGNVVVTENVPNVPNAQVCSSLKLIHFGGDAWTNGGNATPQFNAGTQVCTLSQTVSSLSPFAVVQGGNFQSNSATLFDFDGDHKTDVSIFRPSVGEWWYARSSDGGNRAAQFGSSADKTTPGDFTGDGKTDIAFWRPSNGNWYILRSEDGSFFSFPFGASGDIPTVSDFDGDGKADAAVFRPSNGTWYILNSNGSGTSIVNFGTSEDKPVPADFDGDGKADIAIFRPSDGSWWYLQSSNAQFKVYRFGVSTDKPVQSDWTGDGKADIAIFRPATGEWFVQRSEDNSFFSFPFGTSGDLPVPGDYDGDGKTDAGVFRPSNTTWYLNRSTAGVAIQAFGLSTDRPVPGSFIP